MAIEDRRQDRIDQMKAKRRLVWACMVVVPVLLIIFFKGPAGMTNWYHSWFASSYGSDWYVVQYAQSGCVITDWNLRDRAVDNEPNSDGIYFISRGETVVHLSGHYTYIQNPTESEIEALQGAGMCRAPSRRR